VYIIEMYRIKGCWSKIGFLDVPQQMHDESLHSVFMF